MSFGTQAQKAEEPISDIIDFSKSIDPSALKGKCALVTGGVSGLGEAFVEAFVNAGSEVFALDVNSQLGADKEQQWQAQGLNAHFIQADVTSWTSLVDAFKSAIARSANKSLDIVVVNAGIAPPSISIPPSSSLHPETDPPEPKGLGLATNLTGAWYSVELALHYFALSDSVHNSGNKSELNESDPSQANNAHSSPAPTPKRSIILTDSLAGYFAIPLNVEYSMAKFGLRGLFKSLRPALHTMNVRINMIAPGWIDTPLVRSHLEQLRQRGVKFARIEDAVEAVLRLACDDSIRGRSIRVDENGLADLRDDLRGLDREVLLR